MSTFHAQPDHTVAAAPPRVRPSDAALVQSLLSGAWLGQACYTVAKLGIADLLADGPETAPNLAARCGADPDALLRLLRALASVGNSTAAVGTVRVRAHRRWLAVTERRARIRPGQRHHAGRGGVPLLRRAAARRSGPAPRPSTRRTGSPCTPTSPLTPRSRVRSTPPLAAIGRYPPPCRGVTSAGSAPWSMSVAATARCSPPSSPAGRRPAASCSSCRRRSGRRALASPRPVSRTG